mmetsp:Transcript_81879/g.162622  ORF Transcript_81879/g.162622 Transcript_81879/m.162622 type:complete len:223 (-) Transcript_81879:332-1000(-)
MSRVKSARLAPYRPPQSLDRPLHLGARFSMKARGPSMKSGVEKSLAMPLVERTRASWSLKAAVTNSSTQAFASLTASGAFTVIRSARATAACITASRPSPSQIWLTRPSWYARSTVMGSPVSMSSMATAWGSLRGRRKRPPAAGISERLTSGTPKTAFFEATTRSHAKTISQPPARALPSTAAIRGFVRGKATMPAKPPFAVWMFSPLLMALRSAPAQKVFG